MITLHLLICAWGTRIATVTGLVMSDIHNASAAELHAVLHLFCHLQILQVDCCPWR